ncbi:hypothetical protein [Brevibacillus reuszeri]|uniref:hypothetical protein n=1 Tax=Brevibacillus reuszeri TaxID=54915 RepID=UPI000CCC92C3|nr:hypothetical protein [Brevibacillus reuszeri]
MKKFALGLTSLALVFSLSTSAFAATTTYFESEPNNSMSTADPFSLTIGETLLRGVLDPIEVEENWDYFKVTPNKTYQATIKFNNPSSLPNGFHFKIRNSSGQIISSTRTSTETLSFQFQKGVPYYIVIDGNSTDNYVPYTLNITIP